MTPKKTLVLTISTLSLFLTSPSALLAQNPAQDSTGRKMIEDSRAHKDNWKHDSEIYRQIYKTWENMEKESANSATYNPLNLMAGKILQATANAIDAELKQAS